MLIPTATIAVTSVLTGLIIYFVINIVAKENKKVAKKYDSHYFLMRSSRIIMYPLTVLACILDVVILGLCVVCAFVKPYVLFICIPLALLVLYIFNKIIIGGVKYSLLVNGENLTYCVFWNSKQKTFVFADISYFVKETSHSPYQTVEIYSAYSADNKKLFGVTSMLSCYDIFTKTVFDRDFEVLSKKKVFK